MRTRLAGERPLRAHPCCLPYTVGRGPPLGAYFEARYPAYAYPCQRFASALADRHA
jgi:hypothetical protein